MKRKRNIWFLMSFLLCSIYCISQTRDTIFITFNDNSTIMEKTDFTEKAKNVYDNEGKDKSVEYFIEQKESDCKYSTRFSFTHFNPGEKTNKKFEYLPPATLKRPKSYLNDKRILDINFFRATPYRQVCKTFEKEDSREQDVVIFIVDVDEMKKDSIVLREVRFSRPVKE